MGKIEKLIKLEEKRQRETLMMIPSENYTYPEVREAVGSVLMHKYSEGTVGKRYYQGNNVIDQIEQIAQQNALKAFGLDEDKWSANIQALSGSPANLAVLNALLNPGEKIMSMYLPDGGHLSHGWRIKPNKNLPAGRMVTLVSKIYNINFYYVDEETQVFDYDKILKSAQKIKPKLIISGGTAYPRQIDHQKMSQIAHKVGAFYLADIAHEAGLIVAKVNNSPFPYADVVTITTHKTLRGPRGAIIICRKDLEEKINKSVFPGLQGGPHNHTIAGIAIALEKSMTAQFVNYAKLTIKNAQILSEELIKYGFKLVSNGTDKHLILVDLTNLPTQAGKSITGRQAATLLEAAGIIANANTIPNDPSSAFNPSGLRLGTQALSARGMGERQMKQIAKFINEIINLNVNPKKILSQVKKITQKYDTNF